MDQIPKSSREFKTNIYVDFHRINNTSISKEEDTDTINMINNENDKTVTNIKYYDFLNFSNLDELNKNDLKSFFDIEDEVHNTYNFMNKLSYDFMTNNEPITFLCKFCRTSVGNKSIIVIYIILVRFSQL